MVELDVAKVGDKVKFSANVPTWDNKAGANDIGHITEIKPESTWPIKVKWDNSNSLEGYYFRSELDLIPVEQPVQEDPLTLERELVAKLRSALKDVDDLIQQLDRQDVRVYSNELATIDGSTSCLNSVTFNNVICEKTVKTIL